MALRESKVYKKQNEEEEIVIVKHVRGSISYLIW